MSIGRMGFQITEGKGFQIRFANGWAVSVQFGCGNYADNYEMLSGAESWVECNLKAGRNGSDTAEVAVFTPAGEFYECPLFEGHEIGSYMTADQVGEVVAWTMTRSTV